MIRVELLANARLKTKDAINTLFTCKYDTLCILGNIVSGDHREIAHQFIKAAARRYKRVYYILGEYELVSAVHTYAETMAFFKSTTARYPNVVLLENACIVDKNLKYVVYGSTFWKHTDLTTESSPMIEQVFSDYYNGYNPIRTNVLHYQSITGLSQALSIARDMQYPLMVLTSYGPDHMYKLDDGQIESEWNVYVNQPEINIWVFGTNPVAYHYKTH